MSTIQEKVSKGIEWLDTYHEGWRSKIDLQKLDMRSGSNCILGQLFGSHNEMCKVVGVKFCTEHGFGAGFDLDDVWKLKLSKR